MSDTNQTANGGSVFRVDKFVVPAAAREEILDKVKATHEVLRRQQGFVQDSCSSNSRAQASSTL
jgi:hypothetical protein